MKSIYIVSFLISLSYIISQGNDLDVKTNNLVVADEEVKKNSNLVDTPANPAESDLFEKINHVVDEFNTYRDNFLLGKRETLKYDN
ncbi:hypothetical protein GVAV_003194 [Gurleya vavrai]